jgi:hypothetical protein
MRMGCSRIAWRDLNSRRINGLLKNWRIRSKKAPHYGGRKPPIPEDASTQFRSKAAGYCDLAELPAGMAGSGAFMPE